MASDEVKEIDSAEEVVREHRKLLLKLASTDAASHPGSMWWGRWDLSPRFVGLMTNFLGVRRDSKLSCIKIGLVGTNPLLILHCTNGSASSRSS